MIQEFYAKNRKAWRDWLIKNHNKETSVWLIFDKGESRTMDWEDIVQEALAFGWIDSRPGKVSDTQSKIYVSRRKPKSVWSKINKAHIDFLLKNKLMHTSGLEAVRIAKENGSWDALNKSDNLELPDELKKLLKKNKKANTNFTNFTDSSKRAILQWIYSAKREETMLNRIKQTVELAEKNIKANQGSSVKN
jgi:uncharacterized protein YdeI (YjbR/CyaY-like superfamily)